MCVLNGFGVVNETKIETLLNLNFKKCLQIINKTTINSQKLQKKYQI